MTWTDELLLLSWWSIEMRALASKVEGQAKDALAKNYTETAKIKYQRAAMYYSAAVIR